MQSSDMFVPKYCELVYKRFWFSLKRKALQALSQNATRRYLSR